MSATEIPYFDIFVCIDEKGGIGKNGDLPWDRLEEDMKYFSNETKDRKNQKGLNIVIMGRRTYESIPEKHRPLKQRINIVLSREKGNDASFYSYHLPNKNRMVKERRRFEMPKVFYMRSMDEAFKLVGFLREARVSSNHVVNVIGGQSIYEYFLQNEVVKRCRYMHVTRVHDTFDCDTFFPIDAFERAISDEKFMRVQIMHCDDSLPHYTIEKYIRHTKKK